MKEETANEPAARLLLEVYEQLAVDAETSLNEIRQTLEEARAKYAAARPLTEAERDELAAYVAGGGALCCADGLAWLKERLPRHWAKALNEWAYEHLSCSPPSDVERQTRYANAVRDLPLDKFPMGRE